MKYVSRTIVIVLALVLTTSAASSRQTTLTENDLNTLANNQFSSGELPLGDGRYVTDKPKKGYIYLCRARPDPAAGGAQIKGPWISNQTWNLVKKLSVAGEVIWNNATFSNIIANGERLLSGNSLPINHPTGNFPIAQNDPAYYYDRNPNSILPMTMRDQLPANPVYSDKPFCMGGEAGIMLTGVPLYNGFDAKLRDAAAHEVQDSCQGHPQRGGQYHYHSLSSCIKDIHVTTVIGYALDGFPITGPKIKEGRYLTTDSLDECHGITSEIIQDGVKKITYHYVMTQDFPYSVSCFRGKPTRTGPSNALMQDTNPGGFTRDFNRTYTTRGKDPDLTPSQIIPPPEALNACQKKTDGDPCGFTTPRGDNLTGACRIPPGQSAFACVPNRR